jgi:hypothetical protein
MEKINKITRETELPEGMFDQIIQNEIESVYEEHRKASNYYTQTIHVIDEDYPVGIDPKFYGHWMSNDYVADHVYGFNKSDITEFNRVEQVTTTITKEVTTWELVK